MCTKHFKKWEKAQSGTDVCLLAPEAAPPAAALPEAALQEPAPPEPALQEPAPPEAALQEAALQEPARQEAAPPEAVPQVAALQEAAPQELQEAANPAAAQSEASLQEAAPPEAVPQEAAPPEAALRQRPLMQQTSRKLPSRKLPLQEAVPAAAQSEAFQQGSSSASLIASQDSLQVSAPTTELPEASAAAATLSRVSAEAVVEEESPLPIYHERQNGELCGGHSINCLAQGHVFSERSLQAAKHTNAASVDGYLDDSHPTQYSIDDLRQAISSARLPLTLEQHGVFRSDAQNRQRKKLSESDALLINVNNAHWKTFFKSETGLFWDLDSNLKLPALIPDVDKLLEPYVGPSTSTRSTRKRKKDSDSNWTVYVATYEKKLWHSTRQPVGYHKESFLLSVTTSNSLRDLLNISGIECKSRSQSGRLNAFMTSEYYKQKKVDALYHRSRPDFRNDFFFLGTELTKNGSSGDMVHVISRNYLTERRMQRPDDHFDLARSVVLFDGNVVMESLWPGGVSLSRFSGTNTLIVFVVSSDVFRLEITMQMDEQETSHRLSQGDLIRIPPQCKFRFQNLSTIDAATYQVTVASPTKISEVQGF
jgi:hypothetical protein